MQKDSHRLATRFAFDLLRGKDPTLPLLEAVDAVAQRAMDIDTDRDLEFVDVQGGAGSGGRDDPHRDDTWAVDDQPHTTEQDTPLTTYTHFIDVKKGPGAFDDYDGYAYTKGSASKDQFQKARDAVGSPWEAFLASILVGDRYVDEALAYWFNDEYVHAPGQQWYRSGACSPAIERYVVGVPDLQAECSARFPLAEASGGENRGMPYSVFPPIDSLARWWHAQYGASGDAAALGPVLHALHDASIPHHAAGCCGNWHGRYEQEVNAWLEDWMNDPAFRDQVETYFGAWYTDDPQAPPTKLDPPDWQRTPRRDWPIDMLVTWMALNAYRSYDVVYGHFRDGYRFDVPNARDLTARSLALTLLVLGEAAAYSGVVAPRGPRIAASAFAHNFGFLLPGATRAFTFELRAEGSEPLHVRDVAIFGARPPSSAGPFRLAAVAPPVPSTLTPGARMKVTVSFTAPRPAVERGGPLAIPGRLARKLGKTLGATPGEELPKAPTPALNPLFRRYVGTVLVRSDAVNAPVLALHVRAGGLPLPRMLDREMAEVRRRLAALPESAGDRKRLVGMVKELDDLAGMWR